MQIERIDLCLALGWTAIFTVLYLISGIEAGMRDVMWSVASVVGACMYATIFVRRGGTSVIVSLMKLELILLLSELLAFIAYVVKSDAIKHRDVAAWLYFYPVLICVGVLVGCIYSLWFWLCRQRWGGAIRCQSTNRDSGIEQGD